MHADTAAFADKKDPRSRSVAESVVTVLHLRSSKFRSLCMLEGELTNRLSCLRQVKTEELASLVSV